MFLDNRLTPKAREILTSISRDAVRGVLAKAAEAARAAQYHWDFSAPANAVDSLLRGLPGDQSQLRRAAVAGLILKHLDPAAELPPSVEALYPDFLERLAEFLTQEGPYEDEFFSKDVRYATGLTVPCGAMACDLYARIGPKLLLRDLATPRGPKALVKYLTGGGMGVWLSDHIDVRDTRDMNPEGWTRLFERIADLLEANRSISGVIGVGWLYDPVVGQITPRLDYCRRTQVENGAFLVRVETGAHHTANATATSPTRKRLVEEGKYVPTCYLIAWPRRPLIGWARRLKSDPSLAFA